MKLLLDTHTLLWLVEGDPRLSQPAHSVLVNPANDLVTRVATIWGLAIKVPRPQQPLILCDPLEAYFEEWLPALGIDVMPINQDHALAACNLPWHHRDPFDRMTVANSSTSTVVMNSKHALKIMTV